MMNTIAEAAAARKDLWSLSARELAARIARGDVSALEAAEAHIARIERVNPALNAVVVERFEAARGEAREADRRRAAGDALGPLHGVPITVKECLDLAGTPSTFGLRSRAKLLAAKDDPYVARLRRAGAIVLGNGVQVVTRPWREHVALAVMGAIEGEARGRPDYPAFDMLA